jgi:hypothetical protein
MTRSKQDSNKHPATAQHRRSVESATATPKLLLTWLALEQARNFFCGILQLG